MIWLGLILFALSTIVLLRIKPEDYATERFAWMFLGAAAVGGLALALAIIGASQ